MTNENVRMADIAKALGVSTVAVSKALRDQKGVSEALRARVKALAEEWGYRSPSQVRQLSGKAGYTIGALISARYLDSNESFYWRLYQEVNAQAMRKESFMLLETLSNEDARLHKLPKLIAEGRVDGLIVIGKPPGDYAAFLKKSWQKAMVFLDFYDPDAEVDSVISNSFYGAYQLTDYLIRHGHRLIGYVGTLLATDSITDRYFGYRKAILEYNIPMRREWLLDDRDLATGANTELPFPPEMPTAFVCNCDFIAGMLIRVLRKSGYRVPEDVSVTGFDNYLPPGMCDIGITTYSVNLREMAHSAVRMLLRRLDGDKSRPFMQIIDGQLFVRESVCTL